MGCNLQVCVCVCIHKQIIYFFFALDACEIINITGAITVDRNTVTITFSTDHSAAEYECKLDNEELSPCKFTYLFMYSIAT